MDGSKIEWCDATWNPVRGCSRVSPGCGDETGGGCYAMRQAHRHSGKGRPYEGLTTIRKGKVDWSGVARFIPEQLDQPLRWRKPRRIFVNSMSDLFHHSVSNEEIAAVFGVMAAAPQHTFQVLTKRAERMREWFEWYEGDSGAGTSPLAALYEAGEWLEGDLRLPSGFGYGDWAEAWCERIGEDAWPLPNVWLGVSAEDQQRADERIPHLLATPAAVRFVSAEPLIAELNLTEWLSGLCTRCSEPAWNYTMHTCDDNSRSHFHCGGDIARLHWLICGSESGPGARPMQLEWAESLRDQCAAAGVAYFQKQIANAHDKKGGNPEHWPGGPWPRQFPEVRR